MSPSQEKEITRWNQYNRSGGFQVKSSSRRKTTPIQNKHGFKSPSQSPPSTHISTRNLSNRRSHGGTQIIIYSFSFILQKNHRSLSSQKVGIHDGSRHDSTDDPIVRHQPTMGMIQHVMIIRPNHGKAKQIIQNVFFASSQFTTLGTEALISQNGTKEYRIGWNG